MANKSITSANAQFYLAVAGLYDVPQEMQGYASDDAFMTDALDVAEVMMGVDGKQSGGYTPASTKQTISFQADSNSVDFFENWLNATKATRDILYAAGTIYLSSVQKIYTFTNGILTSTKQLPDAKKVLQPRSFVITWESVDSSPILV